MRKVRLFHHKRDRTDDQLDQLATRFADDRRIALAADGILIEL